MKNSTKVRLHLSKQLFESLTKEIIKEAKANDGYTVAVKQPKTPKQSKAQATSPEVQKTDAEAMMGEAGAPPMPPVPGKSAIDKLNLAGTNMEIKDAKTFAKAILDIAEKLKSKEGFKPESNPSIKKAMDALRTVSSGAPAVPPAGQDKPSQYQKPKMPPVPGQMKEMETKVAEDQMNEIGSEGIAALVGLIPGVVLTAAIIKDIVKYMKDNNLKGIDGFKQAYKAVGGAVSAHMDKTVGGNTPGQGHGVDPSKTFGPQNEEDTLKEYEQYYKMVNGVCYRYNDEGERERVSDHHCR